MKNLTRGCAASNLAPTISPSKKAALLDTGCKNKQAKIIFGSSKILA